MVPNGYIVNQINILKSKDFDISCINPGVSSFWKQTTFNQVLIEQKKESALFPTKDEKLTYDAPRFRSMYSTKMTAKFMRNGEQHKVKIKLGDEVHCDIICSNLRRYMGFFQDKMKHYDEIKMYLGSKTYTQFERDISLK